MFKRLKRAEFFKKLAEKLLTQEPKYWGYRMDADEHEGGFNDGVTYSATDLDRRPQFVKDDDKNFGN